MILAGVNGPSQREVRHLAAVLHTIATTSTAVAAAAADRQCRVTRDLHEAHIGALQVSVHDVVVVEVLHTATDVQQAGDLGLKVTNKNQQQQQQWHRSGGALLTGGCLHIHSSSLHQPLLQEEDDFAVSTDAHTGYCTGQQHKLGDLPVNPQGLHPLQHHPVYHRCTTAVHT